MHRSWSVAATLATTVATGPVGAQPPPGSTLPGGAVNAVITVEIDASAGSFGDPLSVAPDLSVGVTEDLTLAVVHSTFGRTGFRGSAGAGICVTDACAHTYDAVGLEALHAVVRGPLAVVANAGIHATSFDRGHHVAKLGAKLRYRIGELVIASLPSVFVVLTGRDDAIPNRDRIWLPVSAVHPIAGPLSAGLATGFKGPLDDLGDGYEIAAGAFVQYALSPQASLGASWVHGRIIGGDAALPPGTSGLDFRAIHLWVTATR